MLYASLALIVIVTSILIDVHLHNLVTSQRITVKYNIAFKKANDRVTIALIIVLLMLCFTSPI